MEASEQTGDAPAPGEVKDAQQPSKKRSLEDLEQGSAGPTGSSQPDHASPVEPGAKRARTEQEQTEDPTIQGEAEDSGSAEEGELEEDELQEDGEVQSSESESEGMGSEGSSRNRGPRARSKASSGDGDSDAGSRRTTRSMSAAAAHAPAHVGWNQGITSQIRTSLGAPKAAPSAVSTPVVAKQPSAPVASEPASAPAPAVALSEPAQPPQKSGKLSRKEQLQQRAETAAVDKQKAQEDQKQPFTYAPGLTFSQPSKKTILKPKGNNLGTGVWKSKFKSWCQSFISRNLEQKDLLTADILVAALQDYITNRALWSKKKHSTVAIAEARKSHVKNDIAVSLATILKDDNFLPGTEAQPMVVDDEDGGDGEIDQVQEAAANSGGTSSADAQTSGAASEQDDQTSDAEDAEDAAEDEQRRPGPAVMTEEEDLAQQRLYFPGLADSIQICVYCASVGHTSSSCPNTACKFCKHAGHFSWNCPTRERCSKCRQLGHGKAQCTEKLIHLDEEGIECALCRSQDHQESDCEALWRSYKPPQKKAAKKVNMIPAFCSSCGAEGHYNADCALRGNKPRSQTWSLKNRDLYVDGTSADTPISDFDSQPQKPQFNLQIKGSAAKRTHIFYPDSDGSEEGEFISEKVKPRAPVGNIRMSTNIQFNTDSFGPPAQYQANGRGQQRGGWSAQPPLPPGPPPTGPPPPGSYSRMSRSNNNNNQSRPPPPPSNGAGRGLPPKPPAPQSQSQQRGFHSVPPPPNGRGPNPPKKQRNRNQFGNPHAGPASQQQQQQNGGGPAGRRRGKNKRGGKQG
ncbi:Protein AIR2 [Colletotrichum chlorophyti]|uniref:Protein AIR2 n=1 Tax=Colletotrichum chlorophyti TaxID=708187 RepID=A0A1Q8RCW3_9PEZI|nr:Protein AIR2 [Colletotrichum chlorophyti]